MSYRPEDTNILDVIDVDEDTFGVFIVKVNQIVDHLRHTVVTVSNTGGYVGNNSGNGFVTGIFGATTLVANTLRGGNVTNTGLLTVSSELKVSNNVEIEGTLLVKANTTINAAVTVNGPATLNTLAVTRDAIVNGTFTVANTTSTREILIKDLVRMDVGANTNMGSNNTTPVAIYSFDRAEWGSARFTLHTRRGANTQVFEGIMTQNGTGTPQLAVYGVTSAPAGANNGVVSTTSNTTHVRVAFQQTGSNTSVTAAIQLVK